MDLFVFQMGSVDWQHIRAVNICSCIILMPVNIPDTLPVASACARVRRSIDETIDPDSHRDREVKTSKALSPFLFSPFFSCPTASDSLESPLYVLLPD